MKHPKLRLIVDNTVEPSETEAPVVVADRELLVGGLSSFTPSSVPPDVEIYRLGEMGEDVPNRYLVSGSQNISISVDRAEMGMGLWMETFRRQLAASFDEAVVRDVTVDPSPTDPSVYIVNAVVTLPPLRYISSSIVLDGAVSMGALVQADPLTVADSEFGDPEQCNGRWDRE